MLRLASNPLIGAELAAVGPIGAAAKEGAREQLHARLKLQGAGFGSRHPILNLG